MGTEKKHSKSFTAYEEIRNAVKEVTPKIASTQKDVITVSSLINGKNGDKVFYMNSKAQEAIMFTLSRNGVLKSATYIDKEAEAGEKTTFVAKDFDKLQSLVKDKALAKAAAVIDWSKVPTKEEAEGPAQEEEKEAEME